MRKPPVLTDAQRQARRETIMRTKPWTKATGPKTPEGKAAASQRWRKHGLRSEEVRVAQQWVSSVLQLAVLLGKRMSPPLILLLLIAAIPANLSIIL